MNLSQPEEIEKFLGNCATFYDQYLDLIEAGVDWLAETSKACRQRG